jgi:hypothetical protein
MRRRLPLCFGTKPKGDDINSNVGVVCLTLPSCSLARSLLVIMSGALCIKVRFGEISSCSRPLYLS